MNPKNHLITDYFKTLSEDLIEKGYDNDGQENILSSLELQVIELGGAEELSKDQELSIISSLSSIDSYPHMDLDEDALEEGEEILEEEPEVAADGVVVEDTAESPISPTSNVDTPVEAKKGFSKALIITGVVAILVLVAIWQGISWGVDTQRSFVTYEENVEAAEAQVDNVLQRRYDLIPNLVNTVKGYATHEKELFTEVARLRSNWAQESGEKRQKTEAQLESSISKLMLVAESYPTIQSDQLYQNLMVSLESSENRIAVERMRYNESVRVYNSEIRKLPQNLIAAFMGATKKSEYIQVREEAKVNPKVEL